MVIKTTFSKRLSLHKESRVYGSWVLFGQWYTSNFVKPRYPKKEIQIQKALESLHLLIYYSKSNETGTRF
jgi:hypothetical protein